MSSKNLVICDREREFAVRLADYLGRRKELALQVKLCDCPEQIEAIRRETEVDILLADERIEFTEGELSGISKVGGICRSRGLEKQNLPLSVGRGNLYEAG